MTEGSEQPLRVPLFYRLAGATICSLLGVLALFAWHEGRTEVRRIEDINRDLRKALTAEKDGLDALRGDIAALKKEVAVLRGAVALLAGARVGAESTGGAKPRAASFLDIPVLTVADVPLSVPEAKGSRARRQLTVAVTVRFKVPQGTKRPGPGALREFAARLGNLQPEFRHATIQTLSAMSYPELSSNKTRKAALDSLKKQFDGILRSHGLSRTLVIKQVMWRDFFWN